MNVFKMPESGIYIFSEDSDSKLIYGDRLTVGKFNLYDIASKSTLKTSEGIYSHAWVIDAIGVINTMHYAMTHSVAYVFADDPGHIKKIMHKDFLIANKEYGDRYQMSIDRLLKGREWLRSLNLHTQHIIFTDNNNNSVFLRQWQKEWGEIKSK